MLEPVNCTETLTPEIRLPLYDYQCRTCSKVTEVRHGFREAYDGTCPDCGGELARVFNPAGIVFKGSGFYITDSRKNSGSDSASSSGDGASKPSDAASKPGDSGAKSSDSGAKSSDSGAKSSDSGAKSGDSSSKPGDSGSKKSESSAA